MHLMVRSDLRNRLLTTNRFQGHLGLEPRRMVTSRSSHGSSSGKTPAEIHLYPCPKKQRQLCFTRHGRFVEHDVGAGLADEGAEGGTQGLFVDPELDARRI